METLEDIEEEVRGNCFEEQDISVCDIFDKLKKRLIEEYHRSDGNKHFKELDMWKIEELITGVILMEFNWRWKAYLKGEYTQQQFSTGFRKFIKKYGGA